MALEALESDTPKMKEILYLRCGIAANETDSCKAITGEQPDTSRDGNEVLTKVLENGLLGSEIKLLINVAIVAHSTPPPPRAIVAMQRSHPPRREAAPEYHPRESENDTETLNRWK